MSWVLGAWLSVWRLHRWVFAIWLLGTIAVVVEIVSLAAAGFDSIIFSAALVWTIVFQSVHQWIVSRYERLDPQLGNAAVRPT